MKDFKKYLPFLLPAVAIIIMILLAWRWYSLQTQKLAETPITSPKIEIEKLGAEDQLQLDQLSRDFGDYETIKMTALDQNNTGMANVRYQIDADKVLIGIFADLASLSKTELYQVWIKTVDAADWQSADLLNLTKAGYTASLALKTEYLPLDIKVTLENGSQSSSQDLFVATISAQGN